MERPSTGDRLNTSRRAATHRDRPRHRGGAVSDDFTAVAVETRYFADDASRGARIDEVPPLVSPYWVVSWDEDSGDADIFERDARGHALSCLQRASARGPIVVGARSIVPWPILPQRRPGTARAPLSPADP